MLFKKYNNITELKEDIKKNKDYLNNYYLEINDTGFIDNLEILFFEQNLYSFLKDNIKFYNVNTWNDFFNWFYSGSLKGYDLECPKNGFYQRILKVEF